MTGYGYRSVSRDDYQIEIEIKGYNNRYLEIASYINSSLSSYEGYITSQVKKVARRGKIELSVKLKVFESEAQVHLDEALFRQYLAAFRRAEEISSLHLNVDASALLEIEDLFSTSCQKNAEVYKDALDEEIANSKKYGYSFSVALVRDKDASDEAISNAFGGESLSFNVDDDKYYVILPLYNRVEALSALRPFEKVAVGEFRGNADSLLKVLDKEIERA